VLTTLSTKVNPSRRAFVRASAFETRDQCRKRRHLWGMTRPVSNNEGKKTQEKTQTSGGLCRRLVNPDYRAWDPNQWRWMEEPKRHGRKYLKKTTLVHTPERKASCFAPWPRSGRVRSSPTVRNMDLVRKKGVGGKNLRHANSVQTRPLSVGKKRKRS